MQTTIFHSTSELLIGVLNSVKSGSTQLPDFQRGWVWDDERIRRLLVSILQSYPIGAAMILETGNPNVSFKPRTVEGVELNAPVTPSRLILDGQQRLTSLFQALYMDKPVTTHDERNNVVRRWYYLDIKNCVDPYADKDDAVLSVPEDKIVRGQGNQVIADYSTLEKECDAGVLPVNLVFNATALLAWQTEYFRKPETVAERSVVWVQFIGGVQPAFTTYQIPVITLLNTTPKEAVCQVFENVNTGGVTLTVFELLTATFASDNFSLRDDWHIRYEGGNSLTGGGFLSGFKNDSILVGLSNTDFLQALTLLVTFDRKQQNPALAVSCKRREILKLSLSDYMTWADKVTLGFIEAAKFVIEQKVFAFRDLPYATQLIPLAAIFVELGHKAHNHTLRQNLASWLWSGIFGELYGGAVETRFAKDLPQVIEWANGGPEPDTVKEAYFDSNRLDTLRTRNSAAYKGVHILMMREGCRDFLSGVPIDIQIYYSDNIDIHHIFPVAYCKSKGISPDQFNSIVNKTPLSSRTNRVIGGSAPSDYLNQISTEHNLTVADLDGLLQSHLVDVPSVRSDDFLSFYDRRKAELFARIQGAMN
ncbi:MAG: DUF262 domain-containing protein [Desulfitobacteriaceae bacterium]|nr:DUF262 domain-containing protein [Desulfitobacteriaceae bacterium]